MENKEEITNPPILNKEVDTLKEAFEEFSKLSDEEKKFFLNKVAQNFVIASEYKRKTMEVLYKETDGKVDIVGIIDK